MPRLSLFDSPLLLGFDEIERTLDRIAKSSAGGYPPYNIEQIGETRLLITLAVAGFSDDNLSVAVEDRQLVIRGKQAEEAEQEDRIFLYRGIAARQFQRVFVLSDDIEVMGANMDNGLLHIELVRILPEKDVRHIQIQKGSDKKGKNRSLTISAPLNEQK